ncbi:MAG: hypothetical protein ABR881_31855 [Candidatus Sulfotelmatobacter sp.]|jgi:SSS family solute:Na+ symporter
MPGKIRFCLSVVRCLSLLTRSEHLHGKRLRPETTDRALVRIGRVSSGVVMLLAILWSTQGARFSSIFEAISVIAAGLSPPITTVFLLGVFWRRGTKEASIVTLISGFLMGAACFALDLPVFGSEKIITHRLGVSFMMQAWWMFCICSVLFVTVSMFTPAPLPDEIEGLTWKNPLAVLFDRRIQEISDPRVVAALLLITMAVLYYVFR